MLRNLLQGVDSMKEVQRSNEELIKSIKNGVDVNENYLELYQQNTGFIYMIIRKRIRGINDEEDLMQQSFFALVKAVDYFNPDLEETNFLTLLKYCIWNETRNLTSELPAQMQNKIYKYRKTKDKLYNELGREPKNYEIMLEMGISFNQLEEIKRAYKISCVMSLDEPISVDGTTTRLDLYSESTEDIQDFDSNIEQQELRKIIGEALDRLPERSKEVVEDIYYKGKTLEQCGNELNVSRERIRQIKSESFRQLRKNCVLRRKVDGYFNEYKHVGVKQFNNTRTSSVEWLAIKREQMLKKLKDIGIEYE